MRNPVGDSDVKVCVSILNIDFFNFFSCDEYDDDVFDKLLL